MPKKPNKKELLRRKRISRSLTIYYRSKRRVNRERGKSLKRYYIFKRQLERTGLTKRQEAKRIEKYKENRRVARRERIKDEKRITKYKRRHKRVKKVKKVVKKRKARKRRGIPFTLREKFENAGYELMFQVKGLRLFENVVKGYWKAYQGSQNVVMDTDFSFLFRYLRKGATQYSIRVKLVQPASSAGPKRFLQSKVVGQYTYEYLKDDIDNIIRNAAQEAAVGASDVGSKRRSNIVEIGIIAWLPIE